MIVFYKQSWEFLSMAYTEALTPPEGYGKKNDNSNKVTTNNNSSKSTKNAVVKNESGNYRPSTSDSNKVTTNNNSSKATTNNNSGKATTNNNSGKATTNNNSGKATTNNNSGKATTNNNSNKEATTNNSGKATSLNNSSKETTTNKNLDKVTTNSNSGNVTSNTNSSQKPAISSIPNTSNTQSVPNDSGISGASVGTIYWFASDKITQIEGTIKNILDIYVNTKNSFVNLANKVKEYVNVGGKWNDANSKIFAQWWNGDMAGKLIVKPDQGLQIEASEKSYSIKEILNRCANLWWIAVCRQLYSVVNLKYPQQLNNMGELTRRCFMKGADESYSVAPINSENVWTNLMAELTGDTGFEWSLLNLPTENASNGGSSTTELEAFIQMISGEISKISRDLYQYIFQMDFIIKDTPNQNYFFGFKPNANLEVVYNFFEKQRVEFIDSFQVNLKNALSMYDESVNNKINEYLSTKYNLN